MQIFGQAICIYLGDIANYGIVEFDGDVFSGIVDSCPDAQLLMQKARSSKIGILHYLEKFT